MVGACREQGWASAFCLRRGLTARDRDGFPLGDTHLVSACPEESPSVARAPWGPMYWCLWGGAFKDRYPSAGAPGLIACTLAPEQLEGICLSFPLQQDLQLALPPSGITRGGKVLAVLGQSGASRSTVPRTTLRLCAMGIPGQWELPGGMQHETPSQPLCWRVTDSVVLQGLGLPLCQQGIQTQGLCCAPPVRGHPPTSSGEL